METCAVCFHLIFLFRKRREFLDIFGKGNHNTSVETLSLYSDRMDIKMEILKCKASELFFHALAYFVAYLYQKDKIKFPKSLIFSYDNQFQHRFKIFDDLNNLPYQGYELYNDFWQSLLMVIFVNTK